MTNGETTANFKFPLLGGSRVLEPGAYNALLILLDNYLTQIATSPRPWFTGVGPPADTLGIDGDLYLDTASGNLYQKTGATWV